MQWDSAAVLHIFHLVFMVDTIVRGFRKVALVGFVALNPKPGFIRLFVGVDRGWFGN